MCPASKGAAHGIRSRPRNGPSVRELVERFQVTTNRNLEVNKLLGECAHLIVEAERVVADPSSSKDKVALTLLLAREDDLAAGALDNVVDIERTARLNL